MLAFIEGDDQNGVADGVRKISKSLFAKFLIKRNRQSNLDYAQRVAGNGDLVKDERIVTQSKKASAHHPNRMFSG